MSDPEDLPAADAWGGTFRDLWRAARPAGRRRAADLATGVVRLDGPLGAPQRRPPVTLPDPDGWAASLRADGAFAPRSRAPGAPDAFPGGGAAPPASA